MREGDELSLRGNLYGENVERDLDQWIIESKDLCTKKGESFRRVILKVYYIFLLYTVE